MRHLRPLLLAATLTAVLLGCGDSKDRRAEPTPAPKVYEPVSNAEAGRVKPNTSEEDLRAQLKVEPVLVQAPTKEIPGGCLYYRVGNDVPLANVWQYCLDERGVQVVVTAVSPSQPAPPAGASQPRAALLARADSICQSQNGNLSPITKAVARALALRPTPTNRRTAGEEIGEFVENLEFTHEQLAAFQAPPDELETYQSYVDRLDEQIDVLKDARDAYEAGEDDEYDRLGEEFTRLGEEAKDSAGQYGFSQCSASTFG